MAGLLKTKNFDLGILLLRLTIGVLLFLHGYYKLTEGIDWLKETLAAYGLPEYLSYGVFIGEIVAPVLLVVGYRARIASLFIAFNMLMAVFLVLKNQAFALKETGGGWAIELEALFFFGAVTIFLTGGGRYSLTSDNDWD
jgi:putative oxidoreductase